jgi:hypothetical protein
VKNTLGLTDWGISIEWHELPDDTFARIDCAHARREATIALGEAYLKSSPESQRETLVHELLHCHFAPGNEYIDSILPATLGAQTYKTFAQAHVLFEERAIDAIAVAIADMGIIPTPPTEEG